MEVTIIPAALGHIGAWRDLYRHEMNCQIIHDSIHERPGWSAEYVFHRGHLQIGYGSIAIGGPWKAKPTIYELYVLPSYRSHLFDCFTALVIAGQAPHVETQSNDMLLTIPLHTFGSDIGSESILFQDNERTALEPPSGGSFRQATPQDAEEMRKHDLDAGARWLVELDGMIAGAGDILFHYNRPYGDIYMKVAAPVRRRGLGAYLVQELKRVGYQGGNLPAARCNPTNVASRKTLQRAGFVPCGNILVGSVARLLQAHQG